MGGIFESRILFMHFVAPFQVSRRKVWRTGPKILHKCCKRALLQRRHRDPRHEERGNSRRKPSRKESYEEDTNQKTEQEEEEETQSARRKRSEKGRWRRKITQRRISKISRESKWSMSEESSELVATGREERSLRSCTTGFALINPDTIFLFFYFFFTAFSSSSSVSARRTSSSLEAETTRRPIPQD